MLLDVWLVGTQSRRTVLVSNSGVTNDAEIPRNPSKLLDDHKSRLGETADAFLSFFLTELNTSLYKKVNGRGEFLI